MTDAIADFLLNPGEQLMDEPLDLSSWDFTSSSFDVDADIDSTMHAQSTAEQTPSAGHAPTGSFSDSEHHSTDTDTGGTSVNTPILEGLGLSEMHNDQPFGSGGGHGHGGESSSSSMDFKW